MQPLSATRSLRLLVIAAHNLGVRHLAMEALAPLAAELANQTRRLPEAPGCLGQPEMRELIQCALDRGWELIAYEADISRKPPEFGPLSNEETNWRDAEQANNLSQAVRELPATVALMVWCGNHHIAKVATDGWHPMGSQLRALTGIEPFCIDQTRSVHLIARPPLRGSMGRDLRGHPGGNERQRRPSHRRSTRRLA